MKTISKILSAVVILAIANKSEAQSTTNADAFATIVTPISITKGDDMHFGNVAVQSTSSVTGGGTGGTVVLATDGTRTRTDGVSLPNSAGTVNAASFTVTGDGTRTFAITLPATTTLTNQSGSGSMTVSDFVSDPSGTGTLAGGTKLIKVGATLNVSVDQTPGNYKGNFEVTVNYN